MLRIYNKYRTFLLFAPDGTRHVVPPMAFDELDEKFTADITFRSALEAGEITIFESAKQGDTIERETHELPKAEPEKSAPKSRAKGAKKAADAQ